MVEYRRSALDATYGALAHPIRREILERLRVGSATVTDLAAPFDASLAAVSKHIRVLEEAALVDRAISGRLHHVSLQPARLAEASGWLESYRSFWEGRLDALERLFEEGGRGGRR